MAVVLLSQTSRVGPGRIARFPGRDTVRTVQFNPQVGVGFTGVVVVEGSNRTAPGSNDFMTLATLTFSGCTTNFSMDIARRVPRLRVRVVRSRVGAIASYGRSRGGRIGGRQNGSGTTTIVVDSQLRVAGVGTNFRINSPVVPSITTDDVVYRDNFRLTLTDVLDGTGGAVGKQDKIGTITARAADINTLAGTATYGLNTADLQKLADTNARAIELNRIVGVTSSVQDQINTLRGQVVPGLAGTTVTRTELNNFFNTTPTVNMTTVNKISGLTARAADLNVLTGNRSNWTGSDIVKLGRITARAADINRISGFTGRSADLNKIASVRTTKNDIAAIAGLAATGVTVTNIGYLLNLRQNVQSTLDLLPNLSGLTASVNDLNTIAGIYSGTGAYGGQITRTEISYLNGVRSNIQTQLNAKRNTSDTIGIAEIRGARITTTELNYLSGVRSNIQSQINRLRSRSITPSGGTFTGAVGFADGTAAAPSIRFGAATTTGVYRRTSSRFIGLAIGGTRVARFDSNFLVLGSGVATGSPTLRGAGFDRTDPVYSFTSDLTTGMYRRGTRAIGFALGATTCLVLDGTANQTTIGGAARVNHAVVIRGVFQGIKQLGVATVHTGARTGATGATVLYTVPTGRTAIVTAIYIRLKSVTQGGRGGTTTVLRMNVGVSPSYTALVDNTNNTSIFNPGDYRFRTAGQVLALGVGANEFSAISGSSGAAYAAFRAGAAIAANVTVQADFDTFDFDVHVFGFEF